MTSTDVVSMDDEQFAEWLQECESDVANIDPEQVQLQIIARTLRASSVEQALAPDAAVSSKDYVGKPFTLLSFRWSEADDSNEGFQYYAVCQCVDADGQPFVMTSGAGRIVAALHVIRKNDAMPIGLVVKRADRPSRSGNYPMWLEKADAGF